MRTTTWKTDLTTTTNPAVIGEIRLWLKRNGQTIPSRDADAVAKYLRLAIDANNRWGGVLVLSIYKIKEITSGTSLWGCLLRVGDLNLLLDSLERRR